MINGIVLKELNTHSDERGFFREIIRVTDEFFAEGFGQWSHSLMFAGVISLAPPPHPDGLVVRGQWSAARRSM